MVSMKKNQKQNQMTICINDIFRRAYARQGMSYEPLIDDAYEYDER